MRNEPGLILDYVSEIAALALSSGQELRADLEI